MSTRRRREAERLAKTCEEQGFRVKQTRSGYAVLGKRVEDGVVVWHYTPSDHRWLKNITARLRRMGVDL